MEKYRVLLRKTSDGTTEVWADDPDAAEDAAIDAADCGAVEEINGDWEVMEVVRL